MLVVSKKSVLQIASAALTVVLALGAVLVAPPSADAKDKKKKDAAKTEAVPQTQESKIKYFYEHADFSKIVWPNPPAITRIRFLNYWAGEKAVDTASTQQQQPKKKSSWMERVAGVATGETAESKPRWQLIVPNGVAVDSKGRAYVADSKVRAIFIIDVETGKYDMIKNGVDARFQWLAGLMIDDADRLFASDPGMKRVNVFGPDHKLEATITEKLLDPAGMAVDEENRLLYIVDTEQDLVQVYDADTFKFLRSIGKPGTKHASTERGEFAKPIGVAVDKDSNVYVTDTWNNRIEVFDADGTFVRAFGKAGDGPGDFARPKGIAIDGDGHLWICDQVQDRVQVFTPEGRLLIYIGGHGLLPGQFQSLINVTIDKNNRVFTTEQMPGRLQVFRYVTDAEAKAEKDRREQELKKKADDRRTAKAEPASAAPAAK